VIAKFKFQVKSSEEPKAEAETEEAAANARPTRKRRETK
jgi:hypothetical protein